MSDFFYRLPLKWQHIVSIAILFIVPLVLFFQTTLGGKEIQRHDITQWRAGAETVIEYREQFGEEPLWVNNMFGGMPAIVVSVQRQVPNLDVLTGYFNNIYPAFQYWVLLSGMYFLLILMGFRPLTAVFGSLIYGLTTYFPVIIMAGHTSKFFTLAFVPWTFAGYWLITRSPKKIAGLLLFTTAFALEVRAGHPQITYYFMFLMGALWMFDSFKWLKKSDFKKWGTITAILMVGGIMGVLNNAERTLTQKSYAPYSIRGGSDLKGTTGLDTNYAFAWSQGKAETLTLAIPDLFGGASPDYWGPKSFTSGPHYLGAIAIFFVLIALLRVRQKVMYVFLGVGFLAILFSWGGNFALFNKLAFDYIPYFDKFRAPETWLVVTSFCFSIVAVYGLDALIDWVGEQQLSIKKLYPILGIVVGVFILLLVTVKSFDYTRLGEVENIAAQIAQQNQLPANNPQVLQRARSIVETQFIPTRSEKANADLFRLGFFLLAGTGLVYAYITRKISATIVSLSVVLLTAIDMISVGQRYMDETKFVNSNIDPERLIESQRRPLDTFIQENISDNGIYPYRVFPLLDNPYSNAIPSYFYPSLGGYTGAKLALAQDVLLAQGEPMFGGQYGINLDLLAVLNTKYITYNPGLQVPGVTPVYSGNDGVVYEIENVLPKAFFVDQAITVDDPVEAFNLLSPGRVDFSNTAIVENYSPNIVPDSAATVEFTSYTGSEMTLEISRSTPGFLVLSEIYYPDGWVATLNDEEIPIYKTNYLLRGLQIPAGEHTLELDFRPPSFYTGVKLSWASLIFQISLALFLVARRFTGSSSSE
ncbi:MAG: YfhO family protein [bacterium]|nr:YfhO family protein [bacterium]